MGAHAHNPSTWEVAGGGSGIDSYPQVYSEFQGSLGYKRLCFKREEEEETEEEEEENESEEK